MKPILEVLSRRNLFMILAKMWTITKTIKMILLTQVTMLWITMTMTITMKLLFLRCWAEELCSSWAGVKPQLRFHLFLPFLKPGCECCAKKWHAINTGVTISIFAISSLERLPKLHVFIKQTFSNPGCIYRSSQALSGCQWGGNNTDICTLASSDYQHWYLFTL